MDSDSDEDEFQNAPQNRTPLNAASISPLKPLAPFTNRTRESKKGPLLKKRRIQWDTSSSDECENSSPKVRKV